VSSTLPKPRIRPFQLANRQVVGRHRVFDVLHHDVLAPDGRALRGVFTFACPDWCNVVAVTPEAEIVCIWQYRFGTQALELEVPGGVLEANEAPAAAAVRELREETGYEAETIESLGSVCPNPALQGNTCHLFLARGARRTAGTSFDEHEDIEVTLVRLRDLPGLLDEGAVHHALAIVALERALRRLA
jgi:ADP-ribose pyrophosphatase YjhB (NUDIX family)